MKVEELVSELLKLPQDASVGYIYDGALRGCVDCVWLSKGGKVVMCESGEVVYYEEGRPIDAPTSEDCKYWESPLSCDSGSSSCSSD